MIVGAGSLRGGAAEPVLEHGRELAGEPPAPDKGSPIWTSIYLRTTILKIFREERSSSFSDDVQISSIKMEVINWLVSSVRILLLSAKQTCRS